MMIRPARFHCCLVVLAAVAAALASVSTVRGSDPSCGEPVTESSVLTRDLDCSVGDGVVIAADGVDIDCAGHRISGSVAGDTAGVRVEGFADVGVRNCRVAGFSRALVATGAPRLMVDSNSFEGGTAGGILIHDSPAARVIRNHMTGYLFGVRVQRSDGVTVAGNRFDATGGFTAVNLMFSENGVVADNAWKGAGRIFFNPATGGQAQGNTFTGGPSQISMYEGVGCSIRRNQFTGRGQGEGGAIRLGRSTGCSIDGNDITRVDHFGILVQDTPPARAGNRIADNRLYGGSFGIYLEQPAGEVVESNRLDDLTFGVLVIARWEPGQEVRGSELTARIAKNRITGGLIGCYLAGADSLLVERNDVLGSTVGILDLGYLAPRPVVNVYEGNRIEENGFFGMIAWGSSPELTANTFRRNGQAEAIPVQDLGAPFALLEDLRGAVAFLPWAGRIDTFDDGDPANDLVPEPTVGGARSRANLFPHNQGIDIYALDARVAHVATLLDDNRFVGNAPRFRQDWFGLVRVEDGSGDGVEGAQVRILDALDRLVAEEGTGVTGTAPETADPGRPFGLIPQEPGGPIPPWFRITQTIVDGKGIRTQLTPHELLAAGDGATGCAVYTWDGVSQPGEAGQSAGGRYQTAVVILGEPCLPGGASPPTSP